MGGTWMSVVYGFGGMKIVGEDLHFQPFLPEQWTGLSFHLRWRGALLHVQVAESGLTVAHKDGPDVTFHVGGMAHTLKCCETFHA
jgi:maltose phosphorylase